MARKGTGKTYDCIWKLWAQARCNCKEAREPQRKECSSRDSWSLRASNQKWTRFSLSGIAFRACYGCDTQGLIRIPEKRAARVAEAVNEQPRTTYGSNIPRDINAVGGKNVFLGSENYHIDVCSTSKRNEHLTQHISFRLYESGTGHWLFPARATHSRCRAHDN